MSDEVRCFMLHAMHDVTQCCFDVIGSMHDVTSIREEILSYSSMAGIRCQVGY